MSALHGLRLFVLDMDGTFYLGDRALPGSLDFLDVLKSRGGRHLFLTNNSSRTGAAYVARLQGMGVQARREDVLTSADATRELLLREGQYQRLFLIATPEVSQEFREAGFDLDDESPEAVVLTYDTTLDYPKMKALCLHLRKGLPYVATHPDINCPSPDGPLPDIGAFMALVETSTGRRPDRIVGKPDASFLRVAMSRGGGTPRTTIMIGDRLYTDIRCGLNAGVLTGLVLTGETTEQMLRDSSTQPDFVFESLGQLADMLKDS